MDANEIRRQEAERNHLLSVNAYREVPIMGTPAKGSIAADLKAAQEEIHRLLLQVSELQKELAELQHTGQHMTCGRCEQLRETQKRFCDDCNEPGNHMHLHGAYCSCKKCKG